MEGDQEVEILSRYSWRNFFSTINFLKILQKMTKHRTHRTFMLTQYKSSVRWRGIGMSLVLALTSRRY